MSTTRPRDPSFAAADIDLDLVADERADALDPVDATALQSLVARDPAARSRYAGFVDVLAGLATVLESEPLPPMPDDVLIRLDAAIERESTRRVADGAGAMSRRTAPVGRRFGRGLARWSAGLLGTAAVAGGLVLALHAIGGGSTSASSASSSESAAASAGGASVAPTLQADAGSTAAAAPETVTVTPDRLAGVVRALVRRSAVVPTAEPAAPSPQLAAPGLPSPSTACLPARVDPSTAVLARLPVTYLGVPAILVVFGEPGGAAHRVRADVFRTCGSAVLLSQTVSTTP